MALTCWTTYQTWLPTHEVRSEGQRSLHSAQAGPETYPARAGSSVAAEVSPYVNPLAARGLAAFRPPGAMQPSQPAGACWLVQELPIHCLLPAHASCLQAQGSPGRRRHDSGHEQQSPAMSSRRHSPAHKRSLVQGHSSQSTA